MKINKNQWEDIRKERKIVGSLIKRHRKIMRASQSEYADFIGVGRFSTVSSYELGYREAPYRIIFMVLKELGILDIGKL